MNSPIKCSNHPKTIAPLICLSPQCLEIRTCCLQCIQAKHHFNHTTVRIESYYEVCKSFKNFHHVSQEKILKRIQQSKTDFIKKCSVFEQTIKSLFFSIDLSKYQCGQAQQITGQASLLCRNNLFIKLFNKQKLADIQNYVLSVQKELTQNILQLNLKYSDIFTTLDKQIKKINLKHSKQIISKLNVTNSQIINSQQKKFIFSQQLKAAELTVYNNNRLKRQSSKSVGYTKHGLVSEPLTKIKNQISFLLYSQPASRFVYVGVCNKEKFVLQEFSRGFQIGGGMVAIRQNVDVNCNAVCLHDQDDQYSDESIVNWDFCKGDIIKLTLNFEKDILLFTKNQKQQFQMPINVSKQWYPFVGLKCKGDQWMII